MKLDAFIALIMPIGFYLARENSIIRIVIESYSMPNISNNFYAYAYVTFAKTKYICKTAQVSLDMRTNRSSDE